MNGNNSMAPYNCPCAAKGHCIAIKEIMEGFKGMAHAQDASVNSIHSAASG